MAEEFERGFEMRLPVSRFPTHASTRTGSRALLGHTSRRATLALALLSLVLAGCAATSTETASTQPTPPTPAASPSTPTPTPEPPRLSLLTGLPETAPAPVLIVKLDNTPNAQPHAGLADADLVYVEEVEWGITRLAAVFSSYIPERIGPIRSARISDIDLIAQFGYPAFAFSGAQHKLWPLLEAAPFIDVSANKGGEGYSRDYERRAPYNYFGDGSVLLERADGQASISQDIGFMFGDQAPPGGMPALKVKAEWPYSKMKLVYDPISGLYDVWMDGDPAQSEEDDGGQQAATVVIQYVAQRDSGFGDRGGGSTPLIETVGTGTGLVLRDGRAWPVQWSRPDAQSGTSYTLADGSPMPFKPGQQWILLVNKDRPVKFVQPSASATPLPGASASALPSDP